MSAEPDRHVFAFGGFSLDASQRLLFGANGEPVGLTSRAFDLLLFMVERPGELLDKRTLIKTIWPDVIVEENNLSQAILALRRALGEAPGEHRFIVTVPGRGFRFVAPVTRRDAISRMEEAVELQRAESTRLPTIAVLPFADMSPNRDQEYFADGLSEELSAYLSRLPGLRVIGRTSAFSFKGKNEDLRTISRVLGVKHLLEGSVRKAGDQLRITAQLVDSNGAHVWSETYDREIGDVFAIQDEVARSVAAALSVALSAGDIDVARGGTRNVEAYDAYLAGRAAIMDVFSPAPDDISSGIGHLERAVALDPKFALAWSWLAVTYVRSAFHPERDGEEWNAKALRASSRALELAPDLPSVLAAAAMTSMHQRDWAEAERRFQQAHRLGTGSGSIWLHSGWFFMNVGRPRQALEHFRNAKLLEPLLAVNSVALANAHELSGNLDQVDAELTQSANLLSYTQPGKLRRLVQAMTRRDRVQIEKLISGLPAGKVVHHAMRSHLDDPQAAIAELRRFAEDPGNLKNPMSLWPLRYWAAYFGDPDLALRFFRTSLADATHTYIIWRPIFTDMRRLPGFKDLVRELGLVDYWRATGNWGDFCMPLGKDDFECN